jgi:CRP/FNR family transcriptional regulator, anaerobic regulatory protein
LTKPYAVSNFSLLLNNMKRFVPLTEEDEKQFLAIAKLHHVKKRQFLVQPGFVCTHQIFVVKGALRSYFVTNNGYEHTIQFAVEDWFISDFNSYISQTPASLFVEALEESEVILMPFDAVEILCLNNPKFERFFRMSAQRAFAFSQRRILSNLDKTAEERFVEFNTLYPHIVTRVPQYTLASYLGITPEFLSKIRKKVLLKS